MKDDKFEELLMEALSPEISDEEIMMKPKENIETMKRANVKKVVITAIAACLVFAMTALAAGKIKAFVSGWNLKTYESHADMGKAAEDAGFDVMEMPEQFANGYLFMKTEVQDWNAVDDGFNKVDSFNELTAKYEKDGKELLVYAHADDPAMYADDNDPDPIEVRTINGIEVLAREFTFKFVPSDYEVTEEDKEFEAVPGNFISYGSEDVELIKMATVAFVKDGVRYSIMDNNSADHMEEMVEMAEELLGQ